DRIVLTKTDLLTTPQAQHRAAHLRARLHALNPAAPVLDAAAGEAGPARLLDCGLYNPASKSPDVKRWLAEEAYAAAQAHDHDHDHHHHDVNRHDDRVRAFCLTTDAAIAAAVLDLFLELLRSLHGPKLLRFKAIVKLAESPDTPLVLHGVQHVLHPPAQLPAWPDGDRRTRLVFIVRDIEERTIRELFDAFLGTPAPDRPDRAALTDNPLVPFGGRDR
ncbi:MAG: GTP-binding protein, partial [Pseudorhodoplanes sp.]